MDALDLASPSIERSRAVGFIAGTSPPKTQFQRDYTVSVRLLWPFVRLLGADKRSASALREAGVFAAEFADPDTRLSHGVVMRLLEENMACNPAVGLHAAEVTEPGDFDVVEYAARSCPTLAAAIACGCRYFRLIQESAALTCVPEGDNIALSYGVTESASQPRAATDFAIGSIYKLLRRNLAIDDSGMHVQFVHQEPGYAAEYARVFGIPVRFGAQSNAIVIPSAQLAAPMLRADSRIARAFELRAAHLLQKLKRVDATAERVRELVSHHLDSGQVTMAWTARRLAMSVPTLRRHLEAEGTTYREIVDELRRHFAERELRDGSTSVGELAFLLGFANVGAFHRAFKRWTGIAPTRYRVTSRSEPPAALLD